MNKPHPKITKREEGLWQVKVPLPFPLQWVNSYVALDRGGAVDILDPGIRTEESLARWEEARESIGFRWSDVRSIILTHHHPDHYGLAGWMQSVTGAPVRMSAQAAEQAGRLWGEFREDTAVSTLEMFAAHGLPEASLPDMRRHLESFVPLVSPAPHPERIETIRGGVWPGDVGGASAGGDHVAIGRRKYAAVHTPGHAEGHLSFWDAESRTIFCGDHVLPGITPNVSLLPFGDADPLASYLDSLELASQVPAAKAYPGHREPFEHYAERARAMISHHRERLARMESLLASPRTGYEVCRELFGDKLSMHQLRFALSETIAHLVFLERRGRLQADRAGPAVRFVRRA